TERNGPANRRLLALEPPRQLSCIHPATVESRYAMRITQWGEFGVHCTVYIAERHRAGAATVTAAEIADAQGIDPQYTQQILQRLRRKGLITSVRGPQGGYRL